VAKKSLPFFQMARVTAASFRARLTRASSHPPHPWHPCSRLRLFLDDGQILPRERRHYKRPLL
jgi:hypothetical protein